jgi:hypothetical protein
MPLVLSMLIIALLSLGAVPPCLGWLTFDDQALNQGERFLKWSLFAICIL